MVKDAWVRVKKYGVKIDPEAVRMRVSALKPLMVEQQNVIQTDLASVEESVKPILEEAGIAVIKTPFYLAYAKAIWGKAQKFSGSTLDLEVQFVYETWKGRGLDTTILQRIAEALGLAILKP